MAVGLPYRIVIAVCLVVTTTFAFLGSAQAFEADLSVRPEQKPLERSLVGSSLVIALGRNDDVKPQDILAAAQADYARLLAVLYEEGHFAPTLSIQIDGLEAGEISPFYDVPRIDRVEIIVRPGPKFNFGKIKIGPLAQDFTLPSEITTGKPAHLSVLRNGSSTAIENWRQTGHAKASIVEQKIEANHGTTTLDVEIRIDPGPIAKFGEVAIANDSAVRPDRILEIAAIPEGEVFAPNDLDRALARLRRTGSFSSVTLREADNLEAGDRIPIELDLVDAPPRRIGLGAEIRSLEGLTVTSFWMHRNLLGGAERLRIEAEVSGIDGDVQGLDYRLATTFARPSTFGPDTDFYASMSAEYLDEPLYLSQGGRVEAGFKHRFSEELAVNAGLAYDLSYVSDQFGETEYSYLMIPMVLDWDRRNDPRNASAGHYTALDLMPFQDTRSKKQGIRWAFDGRLYRPFKPDNRTVLAARFQYGGLAGTEIIETAPELLFFSGGSGTVRGYDYNSIGVDVGGVLTGGRSFLGGSLELRTPIYGDFDGVVFYDLGAVSPDSWVDGAVQWHSGAGIGLRYQTGIGPIRFDVAVPVAGENGSVQFYIGVGQAF